MIGSASGAADKPLLASAPSVMCRRISSTFLRWTRTDVSDLATSGPGWNRRVETGSPPKPLRRVQARGAWSDENSAPEGAGFPATRTPGVIRTGCCPRQNRRDPHRAEGRPTWQVTRRKLLAGPFAPDIGLAVVRVDARRLAWVFEIRSGRSTIDTCFTGRLPAPSPSCS
jgi:hypothetical protein